ncbi:transcription factor CTF1 [Xylariaceae sp. FL0016]|nr:transcription factor CTF1 [Xylariaceae sp. FL0016]
MTSEELTSVRSPETPKDTEAATTTTTTGKMSPSSSKPHGKDASSSKKRSSSISESNGSAKITKRRAARACVSCRARKVRCDVVEGAPCGNCRWDNVECVVQESRRRKKTLFDPNSSVAHNASAPHAHPAEANLKAKTSANPINIASAASAESLRRPSNVSQTSTVCGHDANDHGSIMHGGKEGHVPHLLYQRVGVNPAVLANLQASNDGSRYPSIWPNPNTGQGAATGLGMSRTMQFLQSLEEPDSASQLPAFVKPLPAKIAPEDVSYLHLKGALTLPNLKLQSALLRAYIEYVHPYMPLIELHDFLSIINARDGAHGQTSLFLYQAVLFAATAYVDLKCLKEAGFANRKAARRSFFYKARLLYDFDYEGDRLFLVQGLLLMTYWYETPDDQKDTWHWMGVAISLAHTIGLHRNPAHTAMPLQKKMLWKRIWWSCFMRDRLIALGMRRPTRIKDEDFDVPMLEESDFEIQVLPDDISIVSPDCTLMRDMSMQRELALMCIAKAKLCLCISHMLKAQYSVLIRDKSRPENTTNSTMMLFPNKQLDNVEGVNSCDLELMAWSDSLPQCCRYRSLSNLDVQNGRSTLAVQRNLLHMVYYTTVSALHRPQFLPSSPMHAPQTSAQVQEMSRMRVRDSARQITKMAVELHSLKLERYLPTTGVTVILPAMIIHLLEMKNPVPHARETAMRGFRGCMKVMERLRDIYAAADYAVAFLDAALRKAAIDLHVAQTQAREQGFGGVNGGLGNTMSNDLKAAILSQFSSASSAGVEDMHTPPPETMPFAPSTHLGGGARTETNSMLPPTPTTATATTSMQEFIPPAELFATQHHQAPSSRDAANAVSAQLHHHQPPPPPHQAHSPPHTEERDAMTPSASGSSSSSADSHGGDVQRAHALGDIDMDFEHIEQQDEFDWNAVTGTSIDFDQFLNFPPGEGVGSAGNGVPALEGCDLGLGVGAGAGSGSEGWMKVERGADVPMGNGIECGSDGGPGGAEMCPGVVSMSDIECDGGAGFDLGLLQGSSNGVVA